MLAQVTTKSFNVFLKDGVTVSAKCRKTGRFVKRAIAQVELNAELKAREALNKRVNIIEACKAKQATRMKDHLNMQAKQNVNKAINKSLVEKAKLQMQALIAKVAMLSMITLSVFNIA